MKVYKGVSASPGLVLGQVSRLEHHVETFSHGPFNPERELRLLANAVHTAQNELDSMAERAAPTEQAIFLFQSMMLDDEGMMNEVRFCINAGIGAAAAIEHAHAILDPDVGKGRIERDPAAARINETYAARARRNARAREVSE